MRPILATVSQQALAHNLSVVKQHAPLSKAMAVVKANGYGHGLLNVAQGLSAADGFAVLGLNEAIALREAGYTQTILLLEGVFELAELNIAASFNVDVVVHCPEQLNMLEQTNWLTPIHVHLKMNSGMNRLGFKPEAYGAAYARLKQCQHVASITLMTHFATADEAPGVEAPLNTFELATQGLVAPKSLANSAAILRHPQLHADWVRPGIMLYGASPVGGSAAAGFGLKPAMQLTSQIIAVQTIAVGESVGYGNRFTATKPTRVGIVACGYADGYPRHAPNRTPIAVAGRLTQTLGRVSMDMLYCDLTEIPEANIGAAVELWGAQVPVDAVAEACGTIGYELLCAVAPRVMLRVVD
ncbi:MAG TPA: alanine racemase [Methylophilus sp.]